MTKEQFLKLKAIETFLTAMATEGHDPHPHRNALGELELIRMEIEPGSKHTDFNCNSCAKSMIKKMYNLFKANENTFI